MSSGCSLVSRNVDTESCLPKYCLLASRPTSSMHLKQEHPLDSSWRHNDDIGRLHLAIALVRQCQHIIALATCSGCWPSQVAIRSTRLDLIKLTGWLTGGLAECRHKACGARPSASAIGSTQARARIRLPLPLLLLPPPLSPDLTRC